MSRERNSSFDFEVGATVLAKVKGFPAWPGMIVDEKDLSEAVLAAKPKKKDVHPVLFYNDSNYMWASKNELKSLSPEDARIGASTSSKAKKSLKEAYKIASNPPDYETYIAQTQERKKEVRKETQNVKRNLRTRSKQPDGGLEEDVKPEQSARTRRRVRNDEESQPELEVSGRSTRASLRKRKADVAFVEEATQTQAKKTKRGKRNAHTKKEDKASEDEAMPSGDESSSTGKTEENLESFSLAESPASDEQSGSAKVKNRKSKPSSKKKNSIISIEDINNSFDLRKKLCQQARYRLQRGFIDSPPEASEMPKLSAYIHQIEQVPNIEISLLRQSKVYRVLKAMLMLDEIPLDEKFNIKERVKKLLDKWNTPEEPVIRGIPEEVALSQNTSIAQSPVAEDNEDNEDDAEEENSVETELNINTEEGILPNGKNGQLATDIKDGVLSAEKEKLTSDANDVLEEIHDASENLVVSKVPEISAVDVVAPKGEEPISEAIAQPGTSVSEVDVSQTETILEKPDQMSKLTR